MVEYQYIQELLNTGKGTEGSLLIPKKIYETLIEETEKALLPRELCALYFGPAQIPGSSIDVNLQTPNTGTVRLVGEGAEIPMTETDFTSQNLKPVKYGAAIRITKELMEDSMFNLLDHNLKIVGRRFAENETKLIIQDALDDSPSDVTGGAAATLANITAAILILENNDYNATDIIVGNEFYQDLRNMDVFVEVQKAGNSSVMDTGTLKGSIYGMKVHRFSTNAAPSSTYAKYAYVIDRNFAYMMAEKRGITIENFDLPLYDMSAVAITQRIVVQSLRTQAICLITTS